MCIKQSQYKSDSLYRSQVPTFEWAVVITLATQCEVNWNRNLIKNLIEILSKISARFSFSPYNLP